MKILKSLCVFSLVLAGCSSPTSKAEVPSKPVVETAPVNVLVPTGATALAFVQEASEGINQIEFVTGSEAISAELVKPTPQYDMIVAPVNLGAKMIENGKSEYLLKGIITWGNLYLVGTDENALTSEGSLAAFGENSVPDIIFKNAVDITSVVPEITYYSSAQDVQGMLLSGKATSGLLAEPAVSATIAKAKEQGIELKVIMDLQAAYQEKMKTETAGFPQAAIFVKKGSEVNSEALIAKVQTFVNETVSKDATLLGGLVDKVTPELLGVPNSKLASATWAKQNIHYVEASEVSEDLTMLLGLFGITYNDSMLSK